MVCPRKKSLPLDNKRASPYRSRDGSNDKTAARRRLQQWYIAVPHPSECNTESCYATVRRYTAATKEGGYAAAETAATTGPLCVSGHSNVGLPCAMLAAATTESRRAVVELAAMTGPPRISSRSNCGLPLTALAAGATAVQD